MKKVSVVGGGIGGLAVAIRMAIRGYNVSLFEKSEQLGGKMGQIKEQGYRFDTGPSLFTQPHLLEELILLCNKEPNEYFHYNKLNETCRYFFEDQTMIIGYSDSKLLAKELSNQKLNMRESGCLSLDLAYVGTGRLDGVWANDINIIDIGAGSLIAQEGGALVSDFKGDPKFLDGINIVTATSKIYKSVLKSIKPYYKD